MLPLLLYSVALLAADEIRIGSKLETITIEDEKGKPKAVKLTEGKGTAVIFVDPACQATRYLAPTIDALQSDYKDKGIKFLILNPATATNGNAARMLQVKLTPAMYLFDEAGMLVYRGRVDSAPSETSVSKREARAAIDAVMGKESVKEPEVPVENGCPLQTAN
ncbi:hypothetical protein F183_A03490 [Bryobacterales bacterium F-183]|nr:hypothetical protein F183_A03490 [Bryobacterales bacterium F-183]